MLDIIMTFSVLAVGLVLAGMAYKYEAKKEVEE